MPTVAEIKKELKALKVKGITGKKKSELLEMLTKAKKPASAAAPAPAPRKKKKVIVLPPPPATETAAPKKVEFLNAEDYLHQLIKIMLVEDGKADDMEDAAEVLQKISDDGDYNEYEEEAIESFGGHEEVVRRMVEYYLKKGLSLSRISNIFKNVDEGNTMFEDFIADPKVFLKENSLGRYI